MKNKNIKLFIIVCLISLTIFLLSIVVEDVFIDRNAFKNIPPPNWQGIIPGESDRDDVISILGEPDRIQRESDRDNEFSIIDEPDEIQQFWMGKEVFVYKRFYNSEISGEAYYYDYVHLELGTVYQIIEWLVRDIESGNPLTPEQVFEQYGKPEKVTWSNDWGWLILYCNQGKIYSSMETLVLFIMYFEPMETSDCISKFSEYIRKSGVSFDLWIPEDPWGFNDKED